MYRGYLYSHPTVVSPKNNQFRNRVIHINNQDDLDLCQKSEDKFVDGDNQAAATPTNLGIINRKLII